MNRPRRPQRPRSHDRHSTKAHNGHSSSEETLVGENQRVRDAERRADSLVSKNHVLENEIAQLEAALRARDLELREKKREISELKNDLLLEKTQRISLNDNNYTRRTDHIPEYVSSTPRSTPSRRPVHPVESYNPPRVSVRDRVYGSSASREDGSYYPIPVGRTLI